MNGHLLVVDANMGSGHALASELRRQGHVATWVPTAREALSLARRQPGPDMVLIDLALPDLPGEEVVRTIRGDPGIADLPIVIVSARDSEVDRVVGLAIGADDYVARPFSLRELLLRVQAILRRRTPQGTRSRQPRVGRITVDLDHQQAWVDDAPLDLTSLELRLLAAFVERAGHVLTRDELLQAAWSTDGDAISLRAVDARIKALRRKLGSAAGHLETVRGVGYRLRISAS